MCGVFGFVSARTEGEQVWQRCRQHANHRVPYGHGIHNASFDFGGSVLCNAHWSIIDPNCGGFQPRRAEVTDVQRHRDFPLCALVRRWLATALRVNGQDRTVFRSHNVPTECTRDSQNGATAESP